MSEAAAFTRPPRQARERPPNRVWDHFLDTFYVNRIFDGRKYDVKTALAICLEPLKEMAEHEEWGQNDIILVNYFVHTFHGLCEAQRKEPNGRYIIEYDKWIYFNTGLITANMEPIYAAFEWNRGPGSRATQDNPQYYLTRSLNNFLRDVHMLQYCNPLPDRCRYFDDYTQLIMDGTKTPTVSWTHIIEENWDRICAVLYPTAAVNDWNFKDRQQHDVQIRLQGALTKALIRVHANYRTAVPQSFQGELQLLLPLCILRANIPDLVLTISRMDTRPPIPGVFTYTARTILTLNMAYQNARLIARPEKDWLFAPEIVPDTDDALYDEDTD